MEDLEEARWARRTLRESDEAAQWAKHVLREKDRDGPGLTAPEREWLKLIAERRRAA